MIDLDSRKYLKRNPNNPKLSPGGRPGLFLRLDGTPGQVIVYLFLFFLLYYFLSLFLSRKERENGRKA